MQTFGKTGIGSFIGRHEDELGQDDTGVVDDEVVRKQSICFLNILHHNTGYFLTVKLSLPKMLKLNISKA